MSFSSIFYHTPKNFLKHHSRKNQSSSSVSPTLDPKVHLEDLAAAPLAKKLVEQAKVHVVPAVAVGIEGCLLEPAKLTQRGHAPLVIRLAPPLLQGHVFAVADHDLLPGQNLEPVERRKLHVTVETGWSTWRQVGQR